MSPDQVAEGGLASLALLCALGMVAGYACGHLIGAGKPNRDMRGLLTLLGLLVGLGMYMIGTTLGSNQ